MVGTSSPHFSARNVFFSFFIAVIFLVLASASPAGADSIRQKEFWLSDYGFLEAWNSTRGAGVTVAVIDTGIDGSVAELRGVVTDGTDFSGMGAANGQKPVGADPEHGTMVASLLAGRGRGAENGVIGVAPEASLLAISVDLGDDNADTDTQIAQAVRWAVDHGASVINMSLTRNTPNWPTSWDDAFLYAYQHDVVVVAAAGNRGAGTSEVGAPATIPGVLTVAGVDSRGQASVDSSSQGVSIAVAAPSENLVGVIPGGSYVSWQGTSGAAPLVAGLAALVRSAHPELNANNVINRIIQTAKPQGTVKPDPIFGHGLIDARAAVSTDLPLVATNPLGDLAEWIRIYRPAVSDAEVTFTIAPPEQSAASDFSQSTAPPVVTHIFWVTFGIPLAVFAVFLLLLVVLIFAVVRRFREPTDK